MNSNEAQGRSGVEAEIKRNPHRNFKEVEAARPAFEAEVNFHQTRTVKPDWKVGSGANDPSWKQHNTIQINPYDPARSPVDNYKLLISGIVPRPIGFLSTLNTATSPPTYNLAPFSYTQMVNHDPPIFCIGFSGGKGNAKDSCKNLLETGECTINIISEWFIEAANFCAVNSPREVSEWDLSGLTKAPSAIVAPPRVAESPFSIEAKLVAHHEWESPATPGRKTGVTCLVQGLNFWVREDAVNEERNMLDPGVLKAVSRLGGITYARVTGGFELPRPDWEKEAKPEWERLKREREEREAGQGEQEGGEGADGTKL